MAEQSTTIYFKKLIFFVKVFADYQNTRLPQTHSCVCKAFVWRIYIYI